MPGAENLPPPATLLMTALAKQMQKAQSFNPDTAQIRTGIPPDFAPGGPIAKAPKALAKIKTALQEGRLGKIAPKLFRETSVSRANELLPTTRVRSETGELFFSNNSDLALGQGKNKGVLLEFDTPANFRGSVNKAMPNAEFLAEQGSFEVSGMIGKGTNAELHPLLSSVTVKADAVGDKVSNIVFNRSLKELVSKLGWTKEILEDGSTRYLRP